MTDLIQRLRDGACAADGVMLEAADALESQAAEIERLRADADQMQSALKFIATHYVSDWPERCRENVSTARFALDAIDARAVMQTEVPK